MYGRGKYPLCSRGWIVMRLSPAASSATVVTRGDPPVNRATRFAGRAPSATMAAVRAISVGTVVFVGAFALFATSAAPGLYLRDAGELATAAFTLGVGHPTGFALWCLLAKAATLVPVGEVATRVSFFSALGGAAAAWLVYRAVRALAPGDGAAEAAGVAAAG